VQQCVSNVRRAALGFSHILGGTAALFFNSFFPLCPKKRNKKKNNEKNEKFSSLTTLASLPYSSLLLKKHIVPLVLIKHWMVMN